MLLNKINNKKLKLNKINNKDVLFMKTLIRFIKDNPLVKGKIYFYIFKTIFKSWILACYIVTKICFKDYTAPYVLILWKKNN